MQFGVPGQRVAGYDGIAPFDVQVLMLILEVGEPDKLVEMEMVEGGLVRELIPPIDDETKEIAVAPSSDFEEIVVLMEPDCDIGIVELKEDTAGDAIIPAVEEDVKLKPAYTRRPESWST